MYLKMRASKQISTTVIKSEFLNKVFFFHQGCGYPPNVDCHNFLKTYGRSGTNFTCYVSRSDPALVIVNLNLQEVKAHLFYSIAVPFPCLLLSLLYLILAYKFIYNDPRTSNKKEVRRQNPKLNSNFRVVFRYSLVQSFRSQSNLNFFTL